MSSTEMRQWRRRGAWDLKQQEWKQRDIAQALGVSEGDVSQWLKRVALKNQCFPDLPSLERAVLQAKDELRSRRDILFGSIRQCGYVI